MTFTDEELEAKRAADPVSIWAKRAAKCSLMLREHKAGTFENWLAQTGLSTCETALDCLDDERWHRIFVGACNGHLPY